jgi:hypothetical protein
MLNTANNVRGEVGINHVGLQIRGCGVFAGGGERRIEERAKRGKRREKKNEGRKKGKRR